MERDSARLKMRAERANGASSSSAATALLGSRTTASHGAPPPPPPPPPPSSSRARSTVSRTNSLPPSPSAFSSLTSSMSSQSFSKPPTPSSMASSVASTASAAAVSLVSRRSATSNSSSNSSSGRTTRDVDVLTDKLLAKLHGAPHPLTTRRVVARLSDAPAELTLDSLTVLERMKRKIVADAPLYYAHPEQTISRLHETYSRFVKIKSLDKKTEILVLLYRLMDSVPPQSLAQEPSAARAELSSRQLDATYAAEALGTRVSDAPPALPERFAPPQPKRPPRTDLDALESSFKAAVGIAAAPAAPLPTAKSKATATTAARVSPTRSSPFNSPTSFDVPEEVLLRDVLYALQAIDSRYLYFDAAADRFQITRSVGVPTPLRELIHKLCELGWFYRKISEFLKHHREELSFGVVGQSFCHVLNMELSDYFRLIAVLASQVDEDAETKQPHERSASELTLRKLLVWTQDPLDKMRLMARLIDSVEGLRGGALASGVHSHILHGDPAVSRYVQSVMKRVAAPIFRMIRRWVFEGELEDTHGEFFVVADPNTPDDQLWANKYRLNVKMLPTFISQDLAKKILVIGKSINFIRQCCGNTDWVMNAGDDSGSAAAEEDDDGVHFAELVNLEVMIEKVSASTNEYLIRRLNENYHLLDHCRALKSYLLLGQGDFIQYLMDLLGPELSKRASQIYRHTLTNVLETALNSSNAKFESADILARLDVELLHPSSGDTGWDIFSLHYKLTSPVNTVINEAAMVQYQRIFHFLWRLKRVEHALSASWSKDMHLRLIQGRLPSITPLIHRCQLLRSEMIHFISKVHNFMMFEVLETSWHKLVKDLKAAKDLDELIDSHEEYIAAIKKNGFMSKDSRALLNQLKATFDTVIAFAKAQESLYTTAQREVQEDKMRQQTIERRTLEGSWGTSESEAFAQQRRSGAFGPDSRIVRHIDEIASKYSTQLTALLDMVRARAEGGSQELSFLISQFDFNEFYRSKSASPSMDPSE